MKRLVLAPFGKCVPKASPINLQLPEPTPRIFQSPSLKKKEKKLQIPGVKDGNRYFPSNLFSVPLNAVG